MQIILIVISCFSLFLNLGGLPKEISQASSPMLFAEHVGVVVLSWYMIRKMLCRYGKTIQNRYFICFLLGYTISLMFLHFGWTPDLPYSKSVAWGFDPQRYYYYATSLIQSGHVDYSLNYFGVVYLFAGLMIVFGIDPLIPLYFNSLVFLYSVLLVSKYILEKPECVKYGICLLLIPELLYFNVMSSRETVCMAIVSVMTVRFYMFYKYRRRNDLYTLACMFFLLTIIRPPMTFAFICSIIGYLVMGAKRSRKKMAFLFVVISGLLIIFGNLFSLSFGSDSNLNGMIDDAIDKISGNVVFDKSMYEQSSMAALLIPHNPLEFIVFGVIRSLCYVLITPAMITNPLSFLIFTSSQPPGFVNWSTMAMFLTFPLFLRMYMNYRRESFLIKLILITTLVFLLFIGIFNTTIIHPRYRIVYELLYFSITIVSYVEKRNHTKQMILTYRPPKE